MLLAGPVKRNVVFQIIQMRCLEILGLVSVHFEWAGMVL